MRDATEVEQTRYCPPIPVIAEPYTLVKVRLCNDCGSLVGYGFEATHDAFHERTEA